VAALMTSSAGLSLLTAAPALAEETGYYQGSYNVTLGLFLFALPGLYSLIKRSIKSKVRRVPDSILLPSPDTHAQKGQTTRELSRRESTGGVDSYICICGVAICSSALSGQGCFVRSIFPSVVFFCRAGRDMRIALGLPLLVEERSNGCEMASRHGR